MDSLEDKLNSVLSNPQMMSQIMAMAQSLGQSNTSNEPQQQEPEPNVRTTQQATSPFPLDGELLQKVFSATQQTNIDKNQQGLLRALSPFLCQSRIIKLEKAMRAAKIASFAAAALGSKGKGW